MRYQGDDTRSGTHSAELEAFGLAMRPIMPFEERSSGMGPSTERQSGEPIGLDGNIPILPWAVILLLLGFLGLALAAPMFGGAHYDAPSYAGD